MSMLNRSRFPVLALTVIFLTVLTGCATQTYLKALPSDGSRVILINALDPAVTNAHLGATIFGKYNEPIANDWDIPANADAYVKALFWAEQSEVVKVDPGPQKLEKLRRGDYLTRGWSEFYLDATYASWFQALADANHASAIVVLRGLDLQIAPNSVATYGGYGIVSFMGFKPDNAILFSLVIADVFAGNPLSLMHRAGPLNCRKKISTASMNVSNLKDLTARDLEPFRGDLGNLVAQGIGHGISASGLIRQVIPPCEFQK